MARHKKYDMVIIGGGAGGIVCGSMSSSFGARTLLVDKEEKLGGECEWTGCVPSKTLIHLAHVAHTLRTYGAPDQASEVGAKAMEEMRQTRNRIAAENDSEGFLEKMGCELATGTAKFTGPNELEINGERITARKVILATGSSPFVPQIPGLDSAIPLTNQNVFDLDKPPKRLITIGAGPIGLELSQAFHRLGSKVTVLDRGHQILAKDDHELSNLLEGYLVEEGIEITHGANTEKVELDGDVKKLHVNVDGDAKIIECDEILIATGRQANVHGLGLETINIEPNPRGIPVNGYLQTSQPWLYAVGDVTGKYQFSHMAEHEGITAVRNAYFPFPGKAKMHYKWTPWATFTEPELGHIGQTEEEVKQSGREYRVYRSNFEDDDRARSELSGRGLVKLISTPGGKILGAHILGPRAGELMNELTLGIKKGANVGDLALSIHIYPTLGLPIQRAADYYWEEIGNKPWLKKITKMFANKV